MSFVQRLSGVRIGTAKLAAFVAAAAGCSADVPGRAPAREASPGDEAAAGPAAARPGAAAYQRTLAFVAGDDGPAMYAAWDFETLLGPDSVRRTVRGWLGREGDWAQFIEERWTAGPSRAPWRIVPRGPVRLVVGAEDAVREVYYEEGLRGVSVRLGDPVAEWTDPDGNAYQLSLASAALAGQRTPGLAIDVSEGAESADGLAGEWALLVGPGGFALLIVGAEGRYRAWAVADGEEAAWPEVELRWAERRSFERAYRDLPVVWRFRSNGLSGEFRSESAHVGTPEGALLPVIAVYEVNGTVAKDGDSIPVKGLVRHSQR